MIVSVRILCLFVVLFHTVDVLAQPSQFVGNGHEGMHFEVAFPAVWPSATENALPQPLMLFISSRFKATVKVKGYLTSSVLGKSYPVEAGKVLRIEIKTPYFAAKDGGKSLTGITVTASAPVSISTYEAYQGNGNLTLHYPVETWGRTYSVFSRPQDEYYSTVMQRRPGQIVVLAAEDNTFVTIHPRAVIAANAAIGARIRPDTFRVVKLMAHETLTLLAEIDTTASQKISTDLTGTRISANKPIAVLSGHTKGAVGITNPVLPPLGPYMAPAHFIRNNFYQSLLDDTQADTSFVIVPMMYTATRYTDLGDLVRILALEDGTKIRRSRTDGSGYTEVATIQAGQFYEVDTDTTYRWTTSKPAHIMQFGRSYAKLLPAGEVSPTKATSTDQTQGHPTVEAGEPTMVVVPGESHWVTGGIVFAPEGMDNFLNLVMRTQDVGQVIVDSQPIQGSYLRAIAGTGLTYARMAIAAGTHVITTEPTAKIMAWSYGSLDGLQQGRAYGYPIGVNVRSMCDDSIGVSSERISERTQVIARIAKGQQCASMVRYEILSSKNATLSSAAFQPDTVHSDSIVIVAAQKKIDSIGVLEIRFVSSSGKYVDVTVELPAIINPRFRNHLRYEIRAAKRGQTLIATLRIDSTMDRRFTGYRVTMEYAAGALAPQTSFVADTTIGSRRSTTYEFPVTEPWTETLLGTFEYLVLFGNEPITMPEITDVVWFDTLASVPIVENIIRTIVTDTIVDTIQVDVSDEEIQGDSRPLLTINPQPASDVVSITYSGGLQWGSPRENAGNSLRVYDMSGRVLADLSDRVNGVQGTLSLNTSSFIPGVYVLQLSNGLSAISKRMIIE